MTDNIQHIDVDSDEFIEAPKALRDHVKRLQGKLTEVTGERDTFRDQATSGALSGVLAEFKNPDRVKSAMLGDKVDPLDTEAVRTWLASNGDDYAKGGQSSVSSTDSVTAEERSAQANLNASSEFTTPADMSKFEAAKAEITPEMNGADIKAIYRKHGI